jgi:cell division protein FtsW (lipid II flippase)
MRTRTHILGDRLFALIVISLITIGTATFLSASLGLLARQNSNLGHLAVTQIVLGLIPGIMILVFLRLIKPALIQRWTLAFYVLSLILTMLAFLPHLTP